MASVNKATLIGNLGRDPEVRYSADGNAIANISIATTETWKDKQTGEKKEATEWHRVVFFNRLAEIVGEYLKKGSQIYVEGQIKTRKWKDKEGIEKYTTEIVASEMKILGSRNLSNERGRADEGGDSGYSPPNTTTTKPSTSTAASTAPRHDDFHDDVPF